MKIIMYGAGICKDCVEAKELLSRVSHIELDYRSITDSTKTLKEFLYYRDHEELFDSVKADGKIGIPLFILEDGTTTLELADVLGEDGTKANGIGTDVTVTNQTVNTCSIDGKGNC